MRPDPSLKITVLGLWHLGCVTAACCSRFFEVTGLDFDRENVEQLNHGKVPLMEPGLEVLVQKGLSAGRLHFTVDAERACEKVNVLWVAYDTPIRENDEADSAFVLNQVRRCIPLLPQGSVVILSSQMPVGTCRQLEQEFSDRPVFFAYVPENLRLGNALDTFQNQDRIVVGVRNESVRPLLERLFSPFSRKILWASPESAEMMKHSINAFLALSIAYMNEIGQICELVGADAKEVEQGLKTEKRIGPYAYLSSGGPFAGGTLAREVKYLTRFSDQLEDRLILIPSIKESNDRHKQWACYRLRAHYQDLEGLQVALLGLTYKPHTDTLRGSYAVELSHHLAKEKCILRAYDPAIKRLPADLSHMALSQDLSSALSGADAAIVCTNWPEFHQAEWDELLGRMHQNVFLDANRFLASVLSGRKGIQYFSVGCPA